MNIYLSLITITNKSIMTFISVNKISVCLLFPLFEEQVASPAMSRHSMNVISNAVQYLNPEQTSVMACDQTLFAIAKQIQWIRHNSYEEDLYGIMLGGLHIEKTAWKALGKMSWTKALGQHWKDSSSCSGWHSNSWKGWFFIKGIVCIQNTGDSCSTVHSVANFLLFICLRT